MEKEKEQWSIETQLTQVKLEREQKRYAELDNRYQMLLAQFQQQQPIQELIGSKNVSMLKQNNSPNLSLTSSSSRSFDTNNAQNTNTTNQANPFAEIGSLSSLVPSSLSNQESQIDDVELLLNQCSPIDGKKLSSEILDIYREKLRKLINELEMADSRATAYKNDCQSLRQRLLSEQESNEEYQKKFLDQELTLKKIKEEYQLSVANYETQLQAMSEHMAALNEKLASQHDEIDVLKSNHVEQEKQGNNKMDSSSGSKKSSSVSMTKVSDRFLLCIFSYSFFSPFLHLRIQVEWLVCSPNSLIRFPPLFASIDLIFH